MCSHSRREEKSFRRGGGDGARRLFFLAVFWTVILCAIATPSTAQVTTGTIEGRVTDASGAVVPGARVTITNPAQGLARTAITGEDGGYAVPQLPPGTYEISVEKEGFQRAVLSDAKLQVAQRARIDIVLEVGALSQTVEVSGAVPLLQTDSSEVGQVIERRRVEELPLNGRQFLQLALLTPGVVENAPGTPGQQIAGTQGPQLTISGNRQDANNYTIDGTTALDFLYNTLAVSPSIDAIEEFKVESSLSSIQWGGQSGGYVNIITKSGSNSFHGSLFEYFRNDKFDAHNFFDDKTDAVPPFKQNQFGGTLGGPIVSDRTFFFGSYEGLRKRKTITALFTVPTLAMRQGDFSGLAPVIDPLTGLPFPGNIIPSSRFNNATQELLTLLPLPTNPTLLTRNLLGTPVESTDSDQFSIRIDHRFGDSDTFFGRYSFINHDGLFPFPMAQFVAAGTRLPGFGQFVTNRAYNISLVYTRVFSPATVMAVRFGYNRTTGGQLHERQGEDWGARTGIQGLTALPDEFGPPNITVTGLNPFGAPGGNVGRFDQTFEERANVSHTRGSHLLEFGGAFARDHFNPTNNSHRGSFTFNGFLTGNAVADFLLGIPFTAVGGQGDVRVTHFRDIGYSFYFSDTWRLRPNFTLVFGGRYEFRSPFKEKDGRQVTLAEDFSAVIVPGKTTDFLGGPWMNPGALTSLQAQIPVVGHEDAGFPRALTNSDHNNFAPRVGFAWTPFDNQKTVVRGGYGLFYNFKPGWLTLVSSLFVPFNSIDVGLNFLFLSPIETSLNTTFPIFVLFPFERDFRDAYVQQYSLGIQHSLTSDLMFEIRYTGNTATKLFTANFFNMPSVLGDQNTKAVPFLSPGSVFVGDGGRSNYNGLTVLAEKRMSKGLAFSGSWTWSRAIDTDSLMASTTSTNLDQSPDKSLERGLSTFHTKYRAVFNFVYELPFGPNRHWASDATGAVGKFLEGWQVSGITMFQAGLPFSVNVAADSCGTGAGNCRPHRIADGNLPSSQRTPDRWFDTSAFVVPTILEFGTAGRDILDGPGIINYDLSIAKNTNLAEALLLRFQADFFNAFNRPNFSFPQRIIDAPGFGQILSARDPRLIQFSLKLIF